MGQELTLAGTQDRALELAQALEREMDMRSNDAREIASLVLSAFAGEDELDDEELDPDLRSVFYELEEHRLLDFRREETRNEEGHIRRYFHWRIRWEEVSPDEAETDTASGEEGTVYDDLPQNAWARP